MRLQHSGGAPGAAGLSPFGSKSAWQRDLNEALAEIYARETSAGKFSGEPPRTKEIYFVRHAKSQSNEHKECMREATLSKGTRLRSAVQLAAGGFNSELCAEGEAQLLEVRPVARSIEGLQAVLYSPLQRAEQT